jgi:Trk K+ transport system NAD-binding subunit/CheY-like chemotaxis protein
MEKVLLVDDEKEFLDTMAERMEARDMDVTTTTSPKEALEKAQEENYDAIILDLMMPEMDGLETLKELKKKNPDLQVILLTGHATVQKGVEAMKLGATDLLEKPADLKVLTEKIKKAHTRKMVLVQKKAEEKVSTSWLKRVVAGGFFLKVIIVGAGEVGFHIAQRLSEESQDVVLIDQNPEQIKRVWTTWMFRLLRLRNQSANFKDAGIKDADMLLATTDSDEVNLISCLIAKNLNPALIKVARLRNEEYVRELPLLDKDHLGIDHVINPQHEMVRNIQRLMEIPGASEVIDFRGGRVKLIGVTVDEASPFAGRKLLSFEKEERDILVGAIVRTRPNLPDQVIIPHGNDSILADDLVYLVARNRDLERILGLFGIKEKSLRRVIIIGAGQTGQALAREMDQAKINTKIIEKDETVCSQFPPIFPMSSSLTGMAPTKNSWWKKTSIAPTSWWPLPGMKKATSSSPSWPKSWEPPKPSPVSAN